MMDFASTALTAPATWAKARDDAPDLRFNDERAG